MDTLFCRVSLRVIQPLHTGWSIHLTDIYLCIPDRYPFPLVFRRWFKEENEQLTPIKFNERIFIVSGGLLKISKAKIEDSGKYLCWVNNTAGEETIQVLLTITGKSLLTNPTII